jgi:hypothetical protein
VTKTDPEIRLAIRRKRVEFSPYVVIAVVMVNLAMPVLTARSSSRHRPAGEWVFQLRGEAPSPFFGFREGVP